jgi:hypothetical protein
MFRKSLLALAAAASLGALALTSTEASAFHFGGGTHFTPARFGGVHFGGHFAFNRNFAFLRRPGHVWIPRHWRWHVWHRPYWVAPVIGTTYAATPSYAATPTCNCLTKQYTQDGAVVFKDVCTNEMAMNPPAQGPASQVPVQQGYLQPQPQPAQ